MEPISEGSARQQPATAGAWLKSVRQQRGLHIAALAVTLKVPQAKLEALEADRFDELPDATFARALATAMCRALKVDPAPVLALLPRTHAQDFDVRPGLNQPFRERGGPVDGGLLTLAARPVVWGPALLLLAAAAIFWMPTGWLPERSDTSASSATPVAVFPPAASGVVAASAPVAEFVAAPAAVPASEPVASAPVATPAPSPVAKASAPLPAVASAPVLAPPPGPALRIAASADTWVEVVDAQGQTLLSRLLREGEQQVLAGAAPYKLRIGNVAGTRVEWRGAAVDLAGRSKDNVARLELN